MVKIVKAKTKRRNHLQNEYHRCICVAMDERTGRNHKSLRGCTVVILEEAT